MCEIQFRPECSPHVTLVAYSIDIILKKNATHIYHHQFHRHQAKKNTISGGERVVAVYCPYSFGFNFHRDFL